MASEQQHMLCSELWGQCASVLENELIRIISEGCAVVGGLSGTGLWVSCLPFSESSAVGPMTIQ